MSRPHQRSCKFRPEIACRLRRFSDGFPPVSPPFDQLLRNGTQLDRAISVATFSFSVFANTPGIYRVPTRSSTLRSICSAEYKGAADQSLRVRSACVRRVLFIVAITSNDTSGRCCSASPSYFFHLTCGQRYQPVPQNWCHSECKVGRLRHSHEVNVPSHRLKLRNLFRVRRPEKEPVTAFIFTCDGSEWCAADCSLHSELLCNAPECASVLVLRRTSSEGLDHEVHQPQSVSG